MSSANRDGLRAAANVLARVMRRVARVKTAETADAVNVAADGQDLLIRAGRPEGEWGWEPIQALMLDDNKRHPFFGNKKRWYYEGYYPITETTVRVGAEAATQAYADTALPALFEEHGFTE